MSARDYWIIAFLVFRPLTPAVHGEVLIDSGSVAIESRNVATFDAIGLHISGDLHVTIAEATPFVAKEEYDILPPMRPKRRTDACAPVRSVPFERHM